MELPGYRVTSELNFHSDFPLSNGARCHGAPCDKS
jgi:hypothetical protein